jgi:hypothetical protein
MKLTVTLAGAEDVRRKLLQIGREPAGQALDKTAEEVELYVGNEAGMHTRPASEGGGALGRSVYMKRIAGGWEIGHNQQVAPHALFVHWGTRPHKIKPKGKDNGGKDLLRFVVGNRFVSKHEVNHPGYKGDPWLVRAAAMAPVIFERHVNAAINRIANGG